MVQQNSKELVRRLFSGKDISRPPFIPWIFSFAARLEQISVKDMFKSPDVLTRALGNAQKLYHYDGIVNSLDSTLEAEACGCEIEWREEGNTPVVVRHPIAEGTSPDEIDIAQIEKAGRIPLVLEATKRLTMTTGKEVAIVGLITGPLTLASHLTGENVALKVESNPEGAEPVLRLAEKVIVKLARLYCELSVDIIVIADELVTHMKPEYINKVASHLRPVWNIVRFYSAFPVILTRDGVDAPQYEKLRGLGADGIVPGRFDPANSINEQKSCVGIAIPLSILTETKNDISTTLLSYLHIENIRRYFFTTEWEIPYNTPVESMHMLTESLAREK
jgi:uroporphyrinogen-III decarboxylase